MGCVGGWLQQTPRAGRLGTIECLVGSAHKRSKIGRSVSANSNADTDAEADAVLGYPIFMLGHGGHDCLPEPKCGLSVAGGQHYEFVSPYASDHIKGANHGAQIISDGFQKSISGGMSQSDRKSDGKGKRVSVSVD